MHPLATDFLQNGRGKQVTLKNYNENDIDTNHRWAHVMTQWVKTPAANPDHLC